MLFKERLYAETPLRGFRHVQHSQDVTKEGLHSNVVALFLFELFEFFFSLQAEQKGDQEDAEL